MNNLTTLVKARKAINAKIAAAKKAIIFTNLKAGAVVTLKTIDRNEMVKTVTGTYVWNRYTNEYGDEKGWIEFTVRKVNKNTIVLKNGCTINKEYIRTVKNNPAVA